MSTIFRRSVAFGIKSSVIMAVGIAVWGCATHQSAASDNLTPEHTITAFLDAVRANSLATMSELWGTSSGPAARSMSHDELQKRLGVMRVYLEHERFEVMPADIPQTGNSQVLRVRLTRAGCTPVVPFTLVRYRQGWLVENVDLTAVGNPTQICRTGTPPPR